MAARAKVLKKQRTAAWLAGAVMLGMGLLCTAAAAQRRPMDLPDASQNASIQRTRLYLKNGSYQIVLSYKVEGTVVRYRSAERGGAEEEVPLALVDLPATERWKRQHDEGAPPDAQRPVMSPELAKEEADRAALTPFIAADLRLPEMESVLALDTFEGAPELVPLGQQGSDLNRETAHAVQPLALNPSAAPHRIAELKGYSADVQLHVAEPVFFVRIGSDAAAASAGAFTVDTTNRGGRATPGGGQPDSAYLIERLDVRYDARVVDSFRVNALGDGKRQPDVIEMKHEPLPGGHWLKLTPLQPLEFGEYALVEVLGDGKVNLNVWDFGVHTDAKENVEAIKPEPKRRPGLERR